MSRRYWISLFLAALVPLGGLALVAVTLGVNGFAGRQSPVLKSVERCRSCAAFVQIARDVSARLDSDSARAFLAGLKPWRLGCEQERQLCTIMLAPADQAGHCTALREEWATLEASLALDLRALSKQASSCKAMSCPVASCDGLAAIEDHLGEGSAALQLFAAQGVPSHRAEPRVFARAAGLLGEGRKALARLTGSLAPDRLDFAGEWTVWRRFGEELDRAADELLAQGDIAPPERAMFSAGADAARVLAVSLETLGAADDLSQAWQKLGDNIGRFVMASARIDEAIAHAVMPPAADLCGLDITDSAKRLEAAMRGLTQNLSACHARAQCPAREGKAKTAAALLSQPSPLIGAVTQSSAALNADGPALTLADSPAPALTLEFAQYSALEPMMIAIAARGNRCLAKGALLGLAPVPDDPAVPPAQEEFPGTDRKIVTLAAPERGGDYLLSLYPLDGAPRRDVPLARLAVTVAPAPTQCAGFAGRWETDFGVMTAIMRGNQLRGTYRRKGAVRPGVVTGIVEGREMKGRWSSDLGEGGVRLVLSAGGDRFSGTWGEHPGETDGAGLWRGQCATDAPPD